MMANLFAKEKKKEEEEEEKRIILVSSKGIVALRKHGAEEFSFAGEIPVCGRGDVDIVGWILVSFFSSVRIGGTRSRKCDTFARWPQRAFPKTRDGKMLQEPSFFFFPLFLYIFVYSSRAFAFVRINIGRRKKTKNCREKNPFRKCVIWSVACWFMAIWWIWILALVGVCLLHLFANIFQLRKLIFYFIPFFFSGLINLIL